MTKKADSTPKRGRAKGGSQAPPPDLKVVAGTALNSSLTDDENSALFHQHLNHYERALGAFKKAQADLRNVGKRAKADLGQHAVSLLKIALDIRDNDDGAEKLQAQIEREVQVARWMGMPVGTQGSLFEPDRRTTEEIADAEGFAAGSDRDTPMKVPEKYGASSSQGQAWAKGWHRAQDAIFTAFEKKGEPLLRPSADAPKTSLDSAVEALSEDTKTDGEA